MTETVDIDTSALYAFLSSSDQFHARARRIYGALSDAGARLHITSYVLVEVSALVHRRLGFQAVQTFLDACQSTFRVWWIDAMTHSETWNRMKTRKGAGPSLVDWTTVIVAQSLRASVFAFDEDFAKEGLPVIS